MDSSSPCSSLLAVDDRSPERARWYCSELEQGNVLFFPALPFHLAEPDRQFLLSLKAGGSRFHKNISYRPATKVLKGASGDSQDHARLERVLREFSEAAAQFVATWLTPYAGRLKLDFASFRPLEEKGRNLPLHQRNDLLHVDAFPSRPTHGGRILRLFVNINAEASRIWNVGQPFHALFPQIMRSQKLDPPEPRAATRTLVRLAAKLGFPVRDRSRYDQFMLYLHDWLKENTDFQQNAPKRELTFPPGSCWMVFTDGVPHAALSGQYALEQTFIIPIEALVSPASAPLRVLESATGVPMAS
jgi:3-deoxy-D-manno-oct-2-ulosonic acid (Kdo) hydroxylase